MSNFTPGPWIANWYYGLRIESEHRHGNDNDGWIIAKLEGPDRDENSRLIAAAPDLYAVVKELQESAGYWSEWDVPLGIVDRINEVIKKVDGDE